MRRRSVYISVFLVLSLLLPTLLGCGEKATYGPAQVHFPEDEGAHPESGMEWWYLNATVSDNLGHEYTAMLAYFNKAAMRPALKIISIADLDAKVFYHEVPAISEHHERLDGSGYPNSLQGETISQMGRIVAAADVFDAMTSHRPYRSAMPVDEVLDHLHKNSGKLYDKTCVQALTRAHMQGHALTQPEREAWMD